MSLTPEQLDALVEQAKKFTDPERYRAVVAEAAYHRPTTDDRDVTGVVEDLAAAITELREKCANFEGAMRAGIIAGCDTAEQMADAILDLRAIWDDLKRKITELREEGNDG